MRPLEAVLRDCAANHRRLCPRQVLGARMGLLAARLLGLELPQSDKRLITIVETDGCFVDGISAASGCAVGRRTLRVEDFGKVAATFLDTRDERALRIAPRPDARELAQCYAPEASSRWEGQLLGYQRMPDEALLSCQWVTLRTPVAVLVGQAGVRAICDACGEEILNRREVQRGARLLCRACAGDSYFRAAARVPDWGFLVHDLALSGAQHEMLKARPGISTASQKPDIFRVTP